MSRTRAEITERHEGVKGRVDTDACVIYDVLILGKKSKNRRTYTDPCIAEALPLYEGMSVRVNHVAPAKGKKPKRDTEDSVGWLQNVRKADDGMRGDFHYLATHPMGPRAAEVAKRNPTVFGLSHHADIEKEVLPDGSEIIHRIFEAFSVDLVDKPATTDGIFEEVTVPATPITIKAYFDAIAISPERKLVVSTLFESVDGSAEMPEGVAPPAADATAETVEGALLDGLEVAFNAVVADLLEKKLTAKDAVARMRGVANAHAKLTGGEPLSDTTPTPAPAPVTESVDTTRLAELERYREVRELCDEKGIAVPGAATMRALVGMSDKRSRVELLEETGAIARAPASRARTGSLGGNRNPPAARPGDVTDGKSFADRLFGARNH